MADDQPYDNTLSRDDIAAMYLDQLPFEPYPAQEEALLAWFTSKQGVMVCAPTGTGKTLIAEAAMFEALHTGKTAYYTTPLIALTDQKFAEMQEAAVRWGFHEDDVGLVTGNRRVNPDASILVVVAEILLNRLLHVDAFNFDDVSAVVMDEFHSFNDRERGIVWEFGLSMLPAHVRTLLLSATVGNARSFANWLEVRIGRKLELVESHDRKVPLNFTFLPDTLLSDQMEAMARGDDEVRHTPALLFCFNREACWTVAEQLKGKSLLHDGQQKRLSEEMENYSWSEGVGPKLKQILLRGVGVHHAGLLPKYRRVVEELFQQKLLSVCVCTETLAAGINLPARSVVIPNLLKGPPGKKKVLEASGAKQMFGRAGRPQFDTQGYVFCLAHEDDVKIARWREKYDSIPEDTKDPKLMRAKKALKKKQPKRRANEQYWDESHFEKLINAPSSDLASRGSIPWRLLAYILDAEPDLKPLRKLISNRLMDPKRLESEQKTLDRMLKVLWRAGYLELEPEPPAEAPKKPPGEEDHSEVAPPEEPSAPGLFDLATSGESVHDASKLQPAKAKKKDEEPDADAPPPYKPLFAYPTDRLDLLLQLRGVNPLYGVFVINQLGIADRAERIQAMESMLEMPGSVAYHLHVPPPDELPPGTLAKTRLDVHLLQLGLATAEELGAAGGDDDEEEEDDRRGGMFAERKPFVLTLAQKLRMWFDYDFPGVHDVYTRPVWAAGELLEFGGDFNKWVTIKKLQKQEGIVFRHLLRLILLINEFTQLCPPDISHAEWEEDLWDISDRLTASCRAVDEKSTGKTLEEVERRNDPG